MRMMNKYLYGDIVVNNYFMKLFSTNVMDMVKIYQDNLLLSCQAALLRNGELLTVTSTTAIS